MGYRTFSVEVVLQSLRQHIFYVPCDQRRLRLDIIAEVRDAEPDFGGGRSSRTTTRAGLAVLVKCTFDPYLEMVENCLPLASSRGGIWGQVKLESNAGVDAGEMYEEARGRNGSKVERGRRAVGGAVMVDRLSARHFRTIVVIECSKFDDHSPNEL
jgi:hypothetical protein